MPGWVEQIVVDEGTWQLDDTYIITDSNQEFPVRFPIMIFPLGQDLDWILERIPMQDDCERIFQAMRFWMGLIGGSDGMDDQQLSQSAIQIYI